MIQRLALQYNKAIAYILFFSFYISCVSPLYAAAKMQYPPIGDLDRYLSYNNYGPAIGPNNASVLDKENALTVPPVTAAGDNILSLSSPEINAGESADFIGGPSQPEMSAFKSAGTNDMVNLFTGDFSYNIPLLDVGGYPVNIFYNGGITMEQEASWVGLGWNINPGTVSRNMRGVPDDFDGTEKLRQEQNIKPNITWGGRFGVDFEKVGIKGLGIGVGLGYSHNNYLGPSLDVGIKGGYSFNLGNSAASEKNSPGIGVSIGVSADLNSRNGLTINPNISLGAQFNAEASSLNIGYGASTSYNSRTGIKGLHLSEQVSYNYGITKAKLVTAKDGTKSIAYSTRPGAVGGNTRSSSISFAKPSYVPTMRMPITNSAYAGSFQLGGAIFGFEGSFEVEVYQQKSQVDPQDRIQTKPMVGYIYSHKAAGNPDAIMDYTRFNDKEVTPKTTIISVPQYAYDVFSISGEGTGGSIRAYRNDYGYVRDNRVRSKDKSMSFGADIGTPGQIGANFNTVKTPTTSGDWEQGNHLRAAIQFGEKDKLDEHVYFRNPGETSVLNDDQYQKIGGTDLVRFKLGTSTRNPEVLPILERFDEGGKKLGEQNILAASELNRNKRTQVVNFLTAQEAGYVGLETVIRSYNTTGTLLVADTLQYTSITRSDASVRRAHHISEINVAENSGNRYVYGIPVYNIHQEDYSVTVNGTPDYENDLVPVNDSEININDGFTGNKDGYKLITKTPPYAHSFLLTGLLSPDYVDITGNGITEDDLGTAVKFNYTKMAGNYKWRTPYFTGSSASAIAHFNDGNLSETRDDKGIISYGERESWYMHSIESKTMIAVFTLEDRKDAKGVGGVMTGMNGNDAANKRLEKIDLYNKADLRKNGKTKAKPVKTVWFEYDYSLCKNAPGNKGTPETKPGSSVDYNAEKGKLTLRSIYFTYNGQVRGHKNKYKFFYGSKPGADSIPAYELNGSDRWGNYKPRAQNPGGLKNSVFPYAKQDDVAKINENAAAWNLNKILLPSGGQLEVKYESDDYAYVQDRRATRMMSIAYLTNDTTKNKTNYLYNIDNSGISDNDIVYINIPDTCFSKQQVKDKYLHGINQLAFKLAVNMPKKKEYLTMYANIKDYGFVNNEGKIWIQLQPVDGYSPLTLTSLDYLREHLPGQAYVGHAPEGDGWEQFGKALTGLVEGLESAFQNPIKYLMSEHKAQTIVLAESFVRLNAPAMKKYGGGHRVKSVEVKDNWNAMTGQYTAVYGQQYDYTTTEVVNGVTRQISSGVASYEPSIGGEENPFQEILQLKNRLPLGPANYEAIEMPVLDAFFPAPMVGYSKVTVRSTTNGTPPANNIKRRSGTGKQVTEFYTARDFPVKWDYTRFDADSDKKEHGPSKFEFFKKWSFDSRALSQGFKVELNDMHGKIKSESAYPENDSTARITYTEYHYSNTGSKGLNEQFDFVHQQSGGQIKPGNMGVDIELMTDTREFTVKSNSTSVQAQMDWFPIGPFQIWLPFIWPTVGKSENNYRAVTTTKVINYHSIVDSVRAMDKGSSITTRNLLYDAETGGVILTRANNEFDRPVYQSSYPAYWAYGGMGLAYKNIDGRFKSLTFVDGKITAGLTPTEVKQSFESGDELYIISGEVPGVGCPKELISSGTRKIWVMDKNKNVSSLTNPDPDFIFIDEKGIPYTRSNVQLRIIRSGKRNILTAQLQSFTSLSSPDSIVGGVRKLIFESEKDKNVLNSSAMEYKEKWQTDKDVIRKVSVDPCTNLEYLDCAGERFETVNPYRKGLLGTFRSHRSMVFYGERTQGQAAIDTKTKIGSDGTLKDFLPYWSFNGNHNLIPTSNAKWVWTSEITRVNARGLELETKDALGIYTAAQYGYAKNLPVAIVSNAKYEEVGNINFEDFSYNEAINKTASYYCAGDKHVESGSTIPAVLGKLVWTDTTSINAHSGNYMIGISPQKSYTVNTFKVGAAFNDTHLINASLKDTTKTLVDPGLNVVSRDNCTPPPGVGAPVITVYEELTHLVPEHPGFIVDVFHGYSTPPPFGDPPLPYPGFKTVMTRYLDVAVTGNITFSLGAQYDTYQWYQQWNVPYVQMIIKNTKGQVVESYTSPFLKDGATDILKTFYLCKGVYAVEYQVIRAGYDPACFDAPYPPSVDPAHPSFGGGFSYFADETRVHANLYDAPGAVRGYKTLTTENGCIYTRPIPGTDSMLNPVFQVPASKKMLLSAWVREQRANQYSWADYTEGKVQLVFRNSSGTQIGTAIPILASGPIIEGWQKIESSFTAPAGAATMELVLTNNSSAHFVYFDDIRVHPFDANMKSYVYDPVNLRLVAEQDANNYTTFYEYDEEGRLVRTKAETYEGIKTIKENRSANQKTVSELK